MTVTAGDKTISSQYLHGDFSLAEPSVKYGDLAAILNTYFPRTAFFCGAPSGSAGIEAMDIYSFVKSGGGRICLDLIGMARSMRFGSLFPDDFVRDVKTIYKAVNAAARVFQGKTGRSADFFGAAAFLAPELFLDTASRLAFRESAAADKLSAEEIINSVRLLGTSCAGEWVRRPPRDPFNVFLYFVKKEDEKFAVCFDRLERLEKEYDHAIPARYIADFEKYAGSGFYDPDSESYRWDISKIIYHGKNSIYPAYRNYAHKYHSYRRLGAEMLWLNRNPGKQPSALPSADSPRFHTAAMGLGEYFRAFRTASETREEYRAVTSRHFLYRHETEEAKEQQNRREAFLAAFRLDRKTDIPLRDLYYCFYASHDGKITEGSADPCALGKTFLQEILTWNAGRMDDDFRKNINRLIALTEKVPESVPDAADGSTGDIYMPTALEKLIWQIAGQIGYTDDYESIFDAKTKQNLRNYAHHLENIISLKTRDNFHKDHWVLWSEEEKEKFFETLRKLRDDEKKDTKKDLRSLKSYYRLLADMFEILQDDPIAADEMGKDRVKYITNLHEIYSGISIDRETFIETEENAVDYSVHTDADYDFGGKDEEFFDYVERFIRQYYADNLKKISDYRIENLFEKYCDIYNIDPDPGTELYEAARAIFFPQLKRRLMSIKNDISANRQEKQ